MKKGLFIMCLLLISINVKVLAKPVMLDEEEDTTEYCCDGRVWDGSSSCSHKGVKTGSCSRTVNITAGSTPTRLSLGESISISGCDNNCTITSTFGDIVSASNSSVTVVKNPPNCTKQGSVTFSRSATINSSGVKTTYTSVTVSFTAYASWNSAPETNKVIWSRNQPTPTSKPEANDVGKNKAYEGCKKDPNNPHKWTCDKIWGRGCSVPREESPACYKEESTGFYYWGLYGGKEGYSYISNINDYKNCVSKFECTTKYPSKMNTTTPCNGEGNLSGTYLKKCDSIYEIKCDEQVKTKFGGPVLDSSLETLNNAYLYPGTGFKYNFSVTSNLSCKGNFNQDRYDSVLNYVKTYANSVNGSSSGDIDDKFYTSALEGLEKIKESYTKWNPNYITGATTTIKDDYKGKSFLNTTLVNTKDISSTIVETCGKLPNGKTDNFEYSEKHELDKQMPVAYLTAKGEIVYSLSGDAPCTNCEAIGRKFFTVGEKQYVGKKDYNYIVTATSLGYGGYGSDETKCNLVLLDNDIIYRHVDLDDPFIQKTDSGHQIGHNWQNNLYSFTKIIKPGVWKEESEYKVVTLTNTENVQIKNETKNNSSYYVGACTFGTANNTDMICRLLRNSKK